MFRVQRARFRAYNLAQVNMGHGTAKGALERLQSF